MRLLITNGHVVDPSAGQNGCRNLLLDHGRVEAVLDRNDGVPEGAEVLDATGLIVSPGFIDLHVHLREPGHEYKETIATGTAAAIAGGWTSICAMPNTDPVNDSPAVTRFIIEQAQRAHLANVFPVGSITKQSKGTELAEMGEMKRAGIVAVSDDGRSVPSAGMMRRAMEYARGFDLPVIDHCEDRSLARDGVMHEGRWSLMLGLAGISSAAEGLDADRDCALAELTGARVHIAHISTVQALNAVRTAKRRGIAVTCEVAPHHWTLTDEAVESYDTNVKMNPPLRDAKDVAAIIEALSDGTIDAIATDHAPHHADEKALEFDMAPFGIVGLETAVGLAMDRLVQKGIVNTQRLVELCSANPARIVGLTDRGTLRKNAHADVTILDPDLNWTFDASRSMSKGRNTPFDGWSFRGGVVATIVGGRVLYRHQKIERPVALSPSQRASLHDRSLT